MRWCSGLELGGRYLFSSFRFNSYVRRLNSGRRDKGDSKGVRNSEIGKRYNQQGVRCLERGFIQDLVSVPVTSAHARGFQQQTPTYLTIEANLERSRR